MKHFADYGDGKNHPSVRSGFRRKPLDISKETREAIAKGTIATTGYPYLDGAGPVNVKIYNPLEVQDGKVQTGGER